jgi:hypothetical protein
MAGNEAILCHHMECITNGTYMASAIYDFDSNSKAWKTILEVKEDVI